MACILNHQLLVWSDDGCGLGYDGNMKINLIKKQKQYIEQSNFGLKHENRRRMHIEPSIVIKNMLS